MEKVIFFLIPGRRNQVHVKNISSGERPGSYLHFFLPLNVSSFQKRS